MQLVFIHGSGGAGLVWKYQTEHFAGSVALTLPGHPDGELCRTIPEASAWVKAQADEHGWQDIVLVGHSLGGGIALQYALDYPEHLKAIVTVGSGGRLRVHPNTLDSMEAMIETPDKFPATLKNSWQKVEPTFAEELRASATRLGPAPFFYDLKACDVFDVMGRLNEIKIPLHAIVGTEDVMTPPKYSEFLRDKMLNATATIIEGGTHFVFAEYPEQVNQAIDDFLAGLT
ncbi:MAG: alpha/beta hydrolase [Pseudomonadota bacterium]